MVDRLFQITFFVAYRVAKVCWFVVRPKTQGAHVAIWVDDQLLLIRNSYKSEYSLVCGGIKRGESSLQAALRETREEVGLELEETQMSVRGQFASKAEYKRDTCTIFEAKLKEKPSLTLDNREVVASCFVTLEEARALHTNDILTQYLAQI